MSTVLIIVLVVVVGLILLALGGAAANYRHRHSDRDDFVARVDEVDRALARAHAEDKGWEPAAVEGAARDAFAERRPGVELRDLKLVQVIDEPGVEQDKAVYRCVTDDGEARLVLGRAGGAWVAESLE